MSRCRNFESLGAVHTHTHTSTLLKSEKVSLLFIRHAKSLNITLKAYLNKICFIKNVIKDRQIFRKIGLSLLACLGGELLPLHYTYQ